MSAADLLAEVQPALSETTQLIAESFTDPQCTSPSGWNVMKANGISPDVKRTGWWPDSTQRVFTRFVTAAAGLAIRESGAGDEPAFIDELLKARLEEGAEDTELAFLPSKILEATVVTRSMQGLSETAVAPLKEAAGTDEQKFGLMKLLSERPYKQGNDPRYQEVRALQILDAFAALGDEESSIRSELESDLEAGSFDSLIGEEILREADDENSGLANAAREEIKNMLELATRLSGETGEFLLAAVAENIDLWPPALKKLFDTRKLRYGQDMKANYIEQSSFLATYRCLPPATTEESMGQISDELIIEVAKQRSVNTFLPTRERLGARATLEKMRGGRRGGGRKRHRATEEPAKVTEEQERKETPEINHRLVYVNADRSESGEESPQFEKVLKDYRAKNRGQRGLQQDLEAVLDHLRTVDLSSGDARGIRPHRFGATQRSKHYESNLPKAYELQPSEIPGLSITSKGGRNLKVVFMLEGDEVKILSIDRGDKIPRLERKVGGRDSGRAN